MAFRSCPPSNADRWGPCPRSVALAKLLPQEEDESWYSVRGHVLHNAAADLFAASASTFTHPSPTAVHRLARGFLVDAHRREGDAPERVGYTVTPRDDEALSHAVLQALDIVDPHDAIAIHLEMDYPAPRWLPMRRGPRLDLVWHAGDGSLGLIDYKFGRHPVKPDCPQLLIYGDTLFEAHPEADEVALWIVQPPNVAQRLVIGREECRRRLDFYVEAAVQVQIMEATDNPEDYTPGEWCHFCPAKGICPAHKDKRKQRTMDAIGHLIEKE